MVYVEWSDFAIQYVLENESRVSCLSFGLVPTTSPWKMMCLKSTSHSTYDSTVTFKASQSRSMKSSVSEPKREDTSFIRVAFSLGRADSLGYITSPLRFSSQYPLLALFSLKWTSLPFMLALERTALRKHVEDFPSGPNCF
jgi:hypothetical protein